MSGNRIALRIDDIGASTKVHERYCERRWLNFGVLRDRRLFGAWGPYREMTPGEWRAVFALLRDCRAKLTVAVTGAWVEEDGTLVPFPEKFPEEAAALREGLSEGLIEIAAHGLTHCVLENKRFLPRLWGSNRSFHREFWDWVPAATHRENVERALAILEGTFGRPIRSFVPPGNVYARATLEACRDRGVEVVNCNNPKIFPEGAGPKVFGNENVLAFHDRELVLYGVDWLRRKLAALPAGTEFRFVGEL